MVEYEVYTYGCHIVCEQQHRAMVLLAPDDHEYNDTDDRRNAKKNEDG